MTKRKNLKAEVIGQPPVTANFPEFNFLSAAAPTPHAALELHEQTEESPARSDHLAADEETATRKKGHPAGKLPGRRAGTRAHVAPGKQSARPCSRC